MSDFKQKFDESLQRLGQINSAIDDNIKSKQEFSNQVVSRLKGINDKIRQLADSIKGLKNELTNLQTQVATNNTGIQNKDAEMQQLKSQIEQLTNEKAAAINELEQLKSQYMADTQDFQKRIDECEANLRALTEQNTAISAERDGLRNELQSKGDLASTHAGEIQKLTDQHNEQLLQREEQLKLQQEEVSTKMKQLQDEIATKDAELTKATDEFNIKASELTQQINALTQQNQEKEQTIQQLRDQLNNLQSENEDLTQRIIAATVAIMEATNRLQELNNPASFDQAGLDAAFSEVESSIQEISNAIQGNSKNTKNSNMSGNEIINYKGMQKPLSKIMKELKSKPQQDLFDPNNPKPTNYALALQDIYNGKEPVKALTDNFIEVKNGAILGGRKTKKNRKYKKQKGGFTYKSNAKRKSFSSLFEPQSVSSYKSANKNNLGRGKTKKIKH
jgi:chromosome segregation ATPase